MEQIKAKGQVGAFLVTPDGSRRQVVFGCNTLLYRCADAVARLFAGFLEYGPKNIGFVYASGNDKMSSFRFTPNDRTNKTQTDIVGDGLFVHDIGISPTFSATAETYAGNRVTFGAMTADNTGSEYIYGFLLKDGAGENARVLAVKKLDNPVLRSAGYAMAASWSVTFS